MKIDNGTIGVLRNFAKINPSLVFQEGNVLKTMSPTKTIMAKSEVTTNFDKRFAIYDLNRFLSALSLFNNPELTFNDKFVTIQDENKQTNYTYADESILMKLPEKQIKIQNADVEVRITNDNLKDCEKALGVLSLPEIVIAGDGESVYLQAADSKNPSADVYSIKIGETDKTFKAIFKSENLKLIPEDYTVIISSKGISHFKGKSAEYWIVVEQHSQF